jgi:hypothetical protein
MTTILQLNPPLPVEIVGKGKGVAHFLVDYGPEAHAMWVVFLDDSRECWWASNPNVRAQSNWSMGRA